MDFDLRQSIQVDSNGNITGKVDPTFNVKTVAAPTPAPTSMNSIAGVVSVNTSGSRSSFRARTASSSPSTSTARPSGTATPA